jgi:hypothetical protein
MKSSHSRLKRAIGAQYPILIGRLVVVIDCVFAILIGWFALLCCCHDEMMSLAFQSKWSDIRHQWLWRENNGQV